MRPVAVEIYVDQDGRHVATTLACAHDVVKNSLLFPQLACAYTAPVPGLELPAVARADQALSLDEAIRDPSPVVRAFISDDNKPAAPEAGDRDPTRTSARRDHHPDRKLGEVASFAQAQVARLAHLAYWAHLGHAIVRIIAELIEELRGDRTHVPTLLDRSDNRGNTMW